MEQWHRFSVCGERLETREGGGDGDCWENGFRECWAFRGLIRGRWGEVFQYCQAGAWREKRASSRERAYGVISSSFRIATGEFEFVQNDFQFVFLCAADSYSEVMTFFNIFFLFLLLLCMYWEVLFARLAAILDAEALKPPHRKQIPCGNRHLSKECSLVNPLSV
jgi:hypothetical protein